VIFVADRWRKDSLEPLFKRFGGADLLRHVWKSMDMWQPFIAIIEESFYHFEGIYCCDKFRVAKHIADAVENPRSPSRKEA
jgi:transposase